jgi:MinD-like ATPase involved in chromosome partitioning or flagellar assembly
MTRNLILLFVAAVLATAQNQKQTFVGVITDTMCGADHKPMNVTPESKCVKDCIRMDKKVKYALYDGKNVYALSDQRAPEKFAAQKVKVTGVLFQKTKILQVDVIEAAK